MPPLRNISKAQKKGRLLLAHQAYQRDQFRSIRQAALAYDVPPRTLSDRVNGRVAREDSLANGRKLTTTEEEVLLQWILSMDERGYPPKPSAVGDAARLLLRARLGPEAFIGKNWTHNFINRQPTLQSRWTRKYDHQRALCEDPVIIEAWFRLVYNTVQKYGILPEDTYNFDETGFALGIASTSRVVTASDRRGKPPQLQPGDREWVTAIETINTSGWYLPPMVIFKGKVHISTWYQETDLPLNWVIGLSENGWTSNELGLKWLSEIFEPNTVRRTIGKYRLLILDGHQSHATPEFDHYCKEHSIITLCMPAHSSHLLQPLDVGCFATLKRSYGRLIGEYIRLGINHVDKAEFLYAFQQARLEAFSIGNIQSGFAATGLVPHCPDQVLSGLQIRPYTPPDTALEAQKEWQSETPHNLMELERQTQALKKHLKRRSNSPPTPTDRAVNQLVKGCQMAMQSAVLLADENERLRVANERQVKKRQVVRKFISKATILTVSDAQALVSSNVEVDEPIEEVEVVVQPIIDLSGLSPKSRPRGNRAGLPSCYVCNGYNHSANECSKGGQSSI
jgi:hypothetical protein